MDLAAPGILLEGPVGTGKTWGACTLAQAGIETSVLMLEPFADVLLAWEQHAELAPCTEGGLLHYSVVSPGGIDWDTMIKNASIIQSSSYETLSKMKAGVNKQSYGQFGEVLKHLSNFTCQRCGKVLGPVDSWSPDRALVVDGMSSLSTMAMDLVVGAKPTKSMGEWGVAMDNLERLVQKLATDLSCWFVLIAHLERETDEVSGGVKLMTSTLGRKLSPRIPRYFHEVIMTRRQGEEFTWTNTDPTADLKNKLLPLADKLPASFVPMVETWRSMAADQGATGPSHATA